MFGDVPKNQKLIPFLNRVRFLNCTAAKLERGDILYFGYNNTEDGVANPLIIFSGYDSKNDLIYGSNLRLFYLDHLTSLGSAFLNRFEKVYWKTVIKDEKEVKEKQNIPYSSTSAFTYEGASNYGMVTIKKIVNRVPKTVNLLREYWRGYKPSNMSLLTDNYLKLSGGNISINIDVANVIINTPPKVIKTKQTLPKEGL
jgi:hypothetical protein